LPRRDLVNKLALSMLLHPTQSARGAARLAATSAALLILAGAAARAADDAYEVKPSSVKATPGEKAIASVAIATKKGWHLNAEAPLTLKLTPGPGITVEKSRLVRADLAASSDSTARFEVALVAAQEGHGDVQAEAGFVICQETLCRPIKEKLVIGVNASPPRAPTKQPAKSRRK
jgi:hypothetical protein